MVSGQLQAAEKAIKALRADDRIRPEHAAVVELVRGLAAAVDEYPDRASLWREYRGAIEQLAQAAAVGEVEDDGQAAFLELVRTPLGDAEKPRTSDSRPAGGSRRRAARDAVHAVAEPGRRRRPGATA